MRQAAPLLRLGFPNILVGVPTDCVESRQCSHAGAKFNVRHQPSGTEGAVEVFDRGPDTLIRASRVPR
jgi:hypothetical protein